MAVMTQQTTEDTISVLDHGFVALDGALASDLAVVNAARVSFNVRSDEMSERAEPAALTASRDGGGKGDSNSDFTDS